jgi:hypothetical protein
MSSATIAVATAVSNVEKAVEKVINDADQHFPEAATVGDAVRQGDVYIQFIGKLDSAPKFYHKLAKPVFPLQLAPGDTKGSRHMLEHSEGIEVWLCDVDKFSDEQSAMDFEQARAARDKFAQDLEKYSRELTGESETDARRWGSKSNDIRAEIADALSFCGPIFNLANPTTVSHPEHGNWILPPGAYRITFQRTIDQDMRIQRVLD